MHDSSRSRFLTIAGAGLAAAALPRAAQAQNAKLRIGAPLSDAFAAPYYIKESGTFARIGFDIDITSIQAASAVVAALAGGAIDLAVADPISGVQAINNGVPIQLLATCGLYSSTEPTAMVVVAKNSPIRQPRDLEGKTLATPQISGLSSAAMHAWLAAAGVDIAKVKIVEMNMAVQTAAIARGTLDAGFIGEPFFQSAKSDVRELGFPLESISKTFALSAWWAPRAWIEADRERARRVVAAIYETARWANSHRSETLAILARDAKMDLEAIRGMARISYATALVLPQVQALLNAAETYKLIDRKVDAATITARL